MRFSNHALLLLGSLAGSSFFPRRVQAQHVSTRLGVGTCVDCANAPFKYIDLGYSSWESCDDHCIQCETAIGAGADLVGHQFIFVGSGNANCRCLFSGTLSGITTTTCEAQAHGATGSNYGFNTGNAGDGEICSVDDNSGTATQASQGVCYTLIDAVPSSAPSDVPSLQPSSMPSDQPSSMPSDVPSDEPSETPSSMPSGQPSSEPSSMPSDDPSSQPSSMPSDVPSSEPSSEPSSMPSCAPSSSPTESPSTEFGVALWYPKWEQGEQGCYIDGQEPTYMAVNPGEWLSTTLQKCCQKYFNGYYYDQCLGRHPPSVGNCAEMLYFPDWQGNNEGCLDNGQEPLYMLQNKDYFLSNSLEECCEKFYSWDYYTCSGTTPVLTNGEYYPDWENNGSDDCTKEGEIPLYMLHNQKYYLAPTLEDCCEKHFSWRKNDCMGATAVGTNKWYVKFGTQSEETCIQDCRTDSGNQYCGGLAPQYIVDDNAFYDTQKECCSKELPWVSYRRCVLNSRSS